MKTVKKRFFSTHAKSSALVVSLVLHAIIIIAALTFVAVKVVIKSEQNFEIKEVKRPAMKLRKLQVPVKEQKKTQAPKLRKTIVFKPKVKTVDIKMPEIVGVKGALGAGAGLGGASGGIGFSIPEINIFGVKGRGEKICIILDSTPEIMDDKIGGIPAYTIIKEELVRILGGLPPTAVFNIIVYSAQDSVMLFPNMVSASSSNVDKVNEWLKPLNAVRPGMGSKEYGPGTLGAGGKRITEDMRAGVFKSQSEWYRPAMMAMKQQADAVFLLSNGWGVGMFHRMDDTYQKWLQTAAGRRYTECHEKAKKLLAAENKERAARGEPPRVLRESSPWIMNKAYFPDIEFPPPQPNLKYTPGHFTDAMLEIRNAQRPKELQDMIGLQKKRSKNKIDFSFNVVHFQPAGNSGADTRFKELTGNLNGNYETIEGLEAIQSSVSNTQ